MSGLDLSAFAGRPVGELLDHLEVGRDHWSLSLWDEPPGLLSKLRLTHITIEPPLSRRVVIQLDCTDELYSERGDWSWEVVRRASVRWVKVHRCSTPPF